jgi:signal transduction histidine kinase
MILRGDHVDGEVWGASFVAATGDEPFADDTEARIAGFTELVATAIANAQARSELRALVEEQTALRHVATLVASGASQEELLDAVAAQASRVVGGHSMALLRFEPEGSATVVARHGGPVRLGIVVLTTASDGLAAQVLRTRRPVRIDDYAQITGPVAPLARELGMRAAAGAPIVVAGRTWGAIEAISVDEPLPPGTEERLAQFADLVATAIENAESRAELTDSRARVIAAADESRRRIQRDLHDGAQQRLVHTIITLKLARTAVGEDDKPLARLVAEALEHAERATAELRELAQGIIPSALGHGGLRRGVEYLLDHTDLAVSVDVDPGRLPHAVEATAYFVIAEALTNAVKHARAETVHVHAAVVDGALELEVCDDGAGGADASRGSGLVGLEDRVAVSGGTLKMVSPPGGGTTVTAVLPISSPSPVLAGARRRVTVEPGGPSYRLDYVGHTAE